MQQSAKKPRLKKCRMCPEQFTPVNSMQIVCGPGCALALARKNAAKDAEVTRKAQKRQDRRRKEELLTVSDWTKKAQKAFNAYVRERDRGLPCISCGSQPNDNNLITGSRWDAGHYRSTGSSPELRFEPLNCHAQCVKCNRNLSGNVVEYRINLIHRIGADNLERLEGPHEPKRYRIEDLKQIESHFKALRKELIKVRT